MASSRPEQRRRDVVVVGAGVSGLACAADLTAAGFDVTVLEARSRIGGRIHTHRTRDGSTVELGAQVVHGADNAVLDLVGPTGATPYRDGAAMVRRDGATAPIGTLAGAGAPWALEGRLATLPATTPGSVADWLDGTGLTPSARTAAGQWFAQSWAGEVDDLDAAGVAAVLRARAAAGRFGAQQVLADGFDAVPAALARDVDVRIDTPVTALRWERGRVQLDTGDPAPMASRAVVLTTPPAALAELRIDPWPAQHRAAAAALPLGDACCVVLEFDRPAPRSEVCFDADGTAGFARAVADRRDVLLVTKAAAADRLRVVLSDPAATAALAGALLPWTAAARMTAVTVADWGRDRWTRGAYTYPRAGAADAPARWAQPLEGTVFVAGEATAWDEPGTVHGALASGRRAAREVQEALS